MCQFVPKAFLWYPGAFFVHVTQYFMRKLNWYLWISSIQIFFHLLTVSIGLGTEKFPTWSVYHYVKHHLTRSFGQPNGPVISMYLPPFLMPLSETKHTEICGWYQGHFLWCNSLHFLSIFVALKYYQVYNLGGDNILSLDCLDEVFLCGILWVDKPFIL